MCVWWWGVATRIRAAKAGIANALWAEAVEGDTRRAPARFAGSSAVGLLQHFGMDRIRSICLWMGPGRSRQDLRPEQRSRSANEACEAAFDDVPAEAEVCLVLHVGEVDTPTLSPECQEPSHQNVTGHAGTAETRAPQCFSEHRVAAADDPSHGHLTNTTQVPAMASRRRPHQLEGF